MKNIRPKQACGLLRRIFGVGARARSSRPARKLTLAALVLAVATFGGVPAVAQAQQDDGAISALTLTSDTPGTLDVSWDAPTGAAPTDYRVNWARSGEDYPPWTDNTANHHPTTTSQQLTDLDEGVEYKVRVRARYHDGADAGSPWSGPWAEATRQVAAQPVVQVQQDDGAISALALRSDTPGVLDVSWVAPTGAAPTDYRVNWARSDEDYPPWTDNTANHHPTTTSQQLTDLDEDVEYKVRVRARYHDGPWSGPWAEATRQVAAQPPSVVRSADEPPVTLEPPKLTVIEPDEPDDPLVALQQSADGPVIELDTDEPDDPPVTLEPPQLTVIEPDTDDPLVALQQSDGSVSEPADGDLPADTTTTGVLIVDGNGVTGRHTDNVTDRNLDNDGNRESSLSPHLYSAEDVDWYAVDLQANNAFYQFDVKHHGGNLPVYRLKIYDSAGNPVMVTVGTGDDERQVAVDNTFGVGGLRESHSRSIKRAAVPACYRRQVLRVDTGPVGRHRTRSCVHPVRAGRRLRGQHQDHSRRRGRRKHPHLHHARGGERQQHNHQRLRLGQGRAGREHPVSDRVGRGLPPRRHHLWHLHQVRRTLRERYGASVNFDRRTDGWCTDLTVRVHDARRALRARTTSLA